MNLKGRFPKLFTALFPFAFAVLYIPGAFTHLQYVWHDFLFRLQPGSVVKGGDPRLILLAVDEDAGKKHGFPLPRRLYAPALDRLKQLGVKVVVFDVMFPEPREGDAELAAATKRFGDVVHLYAQDRQTTAVGSNVTTSLPTDALLKVSKHLGHPNVEFLKDNDGHLRYFQLFRPEVTDPIRPQYEAVSLAAEALTLYLGKTLEQIREEYGAEAKVLNYRLPRTWLKHEARDKDKKEINVPTIDAPYRRISIMDLIAGDLTKEQKAAMKGSIVMVGSTTLGYYDHLTTPFQDSAPGPEYHLNALDNILHKDWLNDTPRLYTLLAIFAAALLAFLVQALSPALSAVAAAAVLLGWLGGAIWSFTHGRMLEFIPPAAAFVAAYLTLTVYRVMSEGAEKRMIKGMFGQFVAPEIVEQLAADPSKVKLGGEKRDLTVFFLDIAHFTTISEKMDPEKLILFLNKYLSALSHVVLERRGTIDKYIGDCIMAFWNAPIENKDHRADAVLAALECQRIMGDLNKQLDKDVPEVPAVRIGINSGVATVGLTGSEKKLQYTVIGDEVNLASRLEGANKFFGSKIIVSEGTLDGCKDRVAARLLGRVRVVGKETPIRIYEPVGEKGKLSAPWDEALPLYEQGIRHFYEKKYDAAVEAFEKLMQLVPDDGPGELYLNRAREYAAIPPDGWDEVFNLTAK